MDVACGNAHICAIDGSLHIQAQKDIPFLVKYQNGWPTRDINGTVSTEPISIRAKHDRGISLSLFYHRLH